MGSETCAMCVCEVYGGVCVVSVWCVGCGVCVWVHVCAHGVPSHVHQWQAWGLVFLLLGVGVLHPLP